MSLFTLNNNYYHQTADGRIFRLPDLAAPHLRNILNSNIPEENRRIYWEEFERRLSIPNHEPKKETAYALLIKFTAPENALKDIRDEFSLEILSELLESLRLRGIPAKKFSVNLNSLTKF